MIDLAERRAEFQIIDNQLSQIENQINSVSTFYPNVSKVRQAKHALEVAERRVNELEVYLFLAILPSYIPRVKSDYIQKTVRNG